MDIKDLLDEKDETGRMKRNVSIIWKIRGYINLIEYWIISFGFPIGILLWIITGDFWKAIGWYLIVTLYSLSANFRGMSLHIENLVEWIIRRNV